MPHYSAQIGFVFNINLILSFFFSLLLGCASTLSPYLLCLYSQLKEFMEGGGLWLCKYCLTKRHYFEYTYAGSIIISFHTILVIHLKLNT